MIHGPHFRPLPPENKINTHNDFELAYLRHQYFRRVSYNPTEGEMQPYMKIVEHFTKNTFFTYYNLFKAVGMYHDDVLNIGRVHLVSFLGLYALDKMDVKKQEFIDNTIRYKYREPDEKDFDQKNKANFTLFFKQRMEDLVRVCRQKVRNIKGKPSEEYIVFCGRTKPPKYPRTLLRNYEELDYRKIDFSVFKSIRKKIRVNHDATIFEFDGTWYVAIALEQKNLDLDDLVGSGYNPYENAHNMQPDDIFEEKESENLHQQFNKRSNYRKRVALRNFVEKNGNRAQYKEEVATAKKLLKSLGD
jgi:hypothetical protein